ncbi:MAG TPA: carbamate kinase [Candidatus Limiplasma sp.]|jgi:carbamate kinase|nr:carbamate kinase [Candidatus Limiplasma sp.]HPR77591.1 carbamate kinase [Candidatus Limiplasma sp.]
MQRTGKRMVIALGGNALGKTLPEQMAAVKLTAKAIADLVEDGHEIILSHGNGPQVGMLQIAMGEYAAKYQEPPAPLSVCVAMSQGYIGYDLQNALREELIDRGIHKAVSTVLTQVRVDPDDPAFSKPTKPIGPFMTREEAEEKVREKGWTVMEDAGRGYRRVVASPKPVEIVEIETVHALLAADQIVVAAGGGGIPVVAHGHHLSGIGAVIDKDLASALMADVLDADTLMILTAVEKVALRYGKPDQQWLTDLPWRDAQRYLEEGQFADGSMKPKVQAAINFVSAKSGRTALITELQKARGGVRGETGTLIH